MYNIPRNIPKVVRKPAGEIFREVLLNVMLYFIVGVVVLATLLRWFGITPWMAAPEFFWHHWMGTMVGLALQLFISYVAASSREDTRVREQQDLYNRLDWGF